LKKKTALSEELWTTAHRGIGGMGWIEMGGIGDGRRVVVEDFRPTLSPAEARGLAFFVRCGPSWGSIRQ
jgi:hypothetical protein